MGVVVALWPDGALAQNLSDKIRQHADENLEHKRRPPPRRRAPPPRHAGPGPAPAPYVAPAPQPPKKRVHDPDDDLPVRVIGKYLRIDPHAGIAYRGWHSQSYADVDVAAQGYIMWSVGLRARIASVLTIERLNYQSSGISSPRREGAGIAVKGASALPTAAMLLGVIGFPIDFILQPIIRYETRAFRTTANPTSPVVIVPHDGSIDDPNLASQKKLDPLTMVSAFETIVVGVQYNHDKDVTGIMGAPSGDVPPIYFGLGYTTYSKPYMFNVGGITLPGYVFDARFQGLGIAAGVATSQRAARPFIDVAVQSGLGKIDLTDDYALNDALPDKWMIGYVQGDLTVGFLYPILRTKPTPMWSISASGGGATFFAFKTQRAEGEPADAPPLNWDILWSVQTGFSLPL